MQCHATLASILDLAAKDRAQLVLENAALRHQLALLKRSVARPRIEDSDRMVWIMLRRMMKEWKEALIFVKPATVVTWHRRGFRYYWKRKSRSKPGRPPISMAVFMLIRRLSRENETWGAPHIVDELALPGHTVAETTVAKYIVRHRKTVPSQTWSTFIQNHQHETAVCDFFTVPTATFKVLYCFVVLSLDRRRILHTNVTSHPTAAWTARQLLEALLGEVPIPRFLMRDRDGNYGWEVAGVIKSLNITEVISAPRSPWQNPFVERVIGSIPRECTDHVIPMGEKHLRRVLTEYSVYYNESRTHQSLDGNAPEPEGCANSAEPQLAAPSELRGAREWAAWPRSTPQGAQTQPNRT